MIEGNRIWDITRVADREETRFEFPDLIRFEGHWYCSFREGDVHGNHPSGRGRIIRSEDGTRWDTVALMEWEGGDVREPKLSITAEGRLMVNTSVYFVSKEPRADGRHYQLEPIGTVLDIPYNDNEATVVQQSVTWLSSDGENWSAVHACPTGVNGWRWSVTWHDGMGYSIAHSGKDIRGTLYRTRDGKSWRVLAPEFFPEGRGNEAALAFRSDGVACCILRCGPTRAMVGVGKPPYYTEWEWKDSCVDDGHGRRMPSDDFFRVSLGGPTLLRLRDGRILAAGRALSPGRDDGHVTLFRLDADRAVLTLFAEAAGTSYPGLVEHEGMIWVTYGLSDASALYLAQTPTPA